MGKASRQRKTGLSEEERAARAKERKLEEEKERGRRLARLFKALAGLEDTEAQT